MAEQSPLQYSDNPYTLRSDGTPDGTRLVRNHDGYVFPPFDRTTLRVEAGKQVNTATHQIMPAAIEIKITDVTGATYTLKGCQEDQPAYEPKGHHFYDPLQGFDCVFTGPDGAEWPIHSFKFAVHGGKDLPFLEVEHGLVKPDIRVTDKAGETFNLTGEGGQGFDCKLLDGKQEMLPGVQWAEFEATYTGCTLSYSQMEGNPSSPEQIVERSIFAAAPMTDEEINELEQVTAAIAAHYGESVTVLNNEGIHD